jgi:hypothetical protein
MTAIVFNVSATHSAQQMTKLYILAAHALWLSIKGDVLHPGGHLDNSLVSLHFSSQTLEKIVAHLLHLVCLHTVLPME